MISCGADKSVYFRTAQQVRQRPVWVHISTSEHINSTCSGVIVLLSVALVAPSLIRGQLNAVFVHVFPGEMM